MFSVNTQNYRRNLLDEMSYLHVLILRKLKVS